MSTVSKMCCICRLDTPNLIGLKYEDEAKDILRKLKEFVDLNVSTAAKEFREFTTQYDYLAWSFFLKMIFFSTHNENIL